MSDGDWSTAVSISTLLVAVVAFLWMGVALSVGGCAEPFTIEQPLVMMQMVSAVAAELFKFIPRMTWELLVQFKWWLGGLLAIEVALRLLVAVWKHRRPRRES